MSPRHFDRPKGVEKSQIIKYEKTIINYDSNDNVIFRFLTGLVRLQPL